MNKLIEFLNQEIKDAEEAITLGKNKNTLTGKIQDVIETDKEFTRRMKDYINLILIPKIKEIQND